MGRRFDRLELRVDPKTMAVGRRGYLHVADLSELDSLTDRNLGGVVKVHTGTGPDDWPAPESDREPGAVAGK